MNDSQSLNGSAAEVSADWLRRIVMLLAAALTVPPVIHLVLTVALTVLRGSLPDLAVDAETVDKLTWLALMATAVAILSWQYRYVAGVGSEIGISNSRVSRSAALLATFMWLLSISWIYQPPELTGILWSGFGIAIALASITIALAIVALRKSGALERSMPFLGVLGWAAILVWFAPLALQPPWGVFDDYHTRFVVNEVLAPLAGAWPLGTSALQYTNVLGIPLALLGPLGSIGIPIPYYAIAVAWLSLLAIAGLVIIVLLARTVLPTTIKGLAPLLTVPLVLISGTSTTFNVPVVSAMFSAFPARLLPLMAVAFVLLIALRRKSTATYLGLGVLVGAAAANNIEFGWTTAVSAVIVLVLASRTRTRMWIVGGASALGTYTAILLLSVLATGTFDPELFGVFVFAFGSGFGNLAMPIVGTWTAFAAILIVGTVVGALTLRGKLKGELMPGALATMMGISGLLQFGYYVGRSATSNLQILLPHIALIIVALIALAWPLRRHFTDARFIGILALVCALPVASLTAVISPVEQWSRLSPINKGSSILAPDSVLEPTVGAVRAAMDEFPGYTVGTAVMAGNYLTLVTGARNLLFTGSPGDLKFLSTLEERTCAKVRNFNGPIVADPLLGEAPNPFCGLHSEPYVNGTFLLNRPN